jgi:hypothetical protein
MTSWLFRVAQQRVKSSNMTGVQKEQIPRLFSTFPAEDMDRMIVHYPRQTEDNLAFAYHTAANKIAESFSGTPLDDLVLLPFLNLYRHAFELELKVLIKKLVHARMRYLDGESQELLSAISAERIKDHLGHNLHRLINEVKEHFAYFGFPETFPKSIETLVLQLHETDKNGTAFRYIGLLPNTQVAIDFPRFALLLDDQFCLLMTVWDYVESMLEEVPTLEEHFAEMISDFEPDYFY